MNTETLYRKFQIGGQVFDEIPLAEATANADKALAEAVEKRSLFKQATEDDIEDGWQHAYFNQYAAAWQRAAVAVQLEAMIVSMNDWQKLYRQRMQAAGIGVQFLPQTRI